MKIPLIYVNLAKFQLYSRICQNFTWKPITFQSFTYSNHWYNFHSNRWFVNILLKPMSCWSFSHILWFIKFVLKPIIYRNFIRTKLDLSKFFSNRWFLNISIILDNLTIFQSNVIDDWSKFHSFSMVYRNFTKLCAKSTICRKYPRIHNMSNFTHIIQVFS